MPPCKWKREDVLKLIEMVEDRNCLWNVASPDYHNQIKRRNCLSEIASALKIPAEEIKKKIHTLRAQHSKERSKMKVKKSGSGSDEIYQTKWEFFSALQFMFRHTEDTRTTNSMSIEDGLDVNMSENNVNDGHLAHQQSPATEQQSSQAFDESSTQSTEQLAITSTDLPLIQSSSDALASATPVRRPTSKKRKAPDSSHELQEQAAINRCMAFLSTVTPRDEFSNFGDYVCNELRLLSTAPDIQFKLKHDIQQLIVNAGWESARRRFRPSSSSSHNSGSLLTSPPFSSPSTPNSENAEFQWEDQRHSPESDLDHYLHISKTMSRQDPSTDF